MLQRLFSRSLRGRRRLVFLLAVVKRVGNTQREEEVSPPFLLSCARVLEISPFALKNRRLLCKLILPVWTEKFRDVSHKFKMFAVGRSDRIVKEALLQRVYVQCDLSLCRVAATSVCRPSIFSAPSRATYAEVDPHATVLYGMLQKLLLLVFGLLSNLHLSYLL